VNESGDENGGPSVALRAMEGRTIERLTTRDPFSSPFSSTVSLYHAFIKILGSTGQQSLSLLLTVHCPLLTAHCSLTTDN